jgi:hypothetical protein
MRTLVCNQEPEWARRCLAGMPRAAVTAAAVALAFVFPPIDERTQVSYPLTFQLAE